MLHASENQDRILARIVWQLLQRERYESLADLTADVKTECARLRLRITPDDLNAAYTLVSSNTPLVHPRAELVEPRHEPAPISREDARRLLDGLTSAMRVMPTPAPPSPSLSPQARAALTVILDEVQAARDRVAALEGNG